MVNAAKSQEGTNETRDVPVKRKGLFREGTVGKGNNLQFAGPRMHRSVRARVKQAKAREQRTAMRIYDKDMQRPVINENRNSWTTTHTVDSEDSEMTDLGQPAEPKSRPTSFRMAEELVSASQTTAASQLADVSNYLGSVAEEIEPIPAKLDAEMKEPALVPSGGRQDAYGWDAELNRRLDVGADDSSTSDSPRLGFMSLRYRRAHGRNVSGASLLQRVLRPSATSSTTDLV